MNTILDRPYLHRLADQAAFAEKLAGREERDDRFLALLGRDHNLDPALLNVEDRDRRVRLVEDNVPLAVLGHRPVMADRSEKRLRIEGASPETFRSRFEDPACEHDQASVTARIGDEAGALPSLMKFSITTDPADGEELLRLLRLLASEEAKPVKTAKSFAMLQAEQRRI